MEPVRTEEHPRAIPAPAVTISSLIGKVAAYSPDGAEELIAEAYNMAHAAHRGQTRKSGEPFVYHPLATAGILAELRLDPTTIAAALLHDVLEDTGISKEELASRFGDELAEIVDGVTKLGHLPSGNLEEAQAESLRKMIVAMSRDVRVIIIKLADRLHNMRTVAYLKREIQLRKATETLEIYAPLAHRLGIYSLKWELEDLSFAALHPRRYEEIKRLVAARRGDREAFINGTAAELIRHLREAGIAAEVRGRVKHFYSIYNKMVRRNKEFSEIYDLAGLRVIVDSVRDCYGALGVIHSLWKPIPGRFKDYIAMPKFNMYQSLHTTVMSNEGKLLEIQIRTGEMEATAEYGIAAHWMYKQGVKESEAARLGWLKSMMEWQKETTDATEFMESLKGELGADEVYVFTPKGDVISLPFGATPIDFAYHVRTEVGQRTIGAKVNDRIVPLDSELVSGDRVEIITGKSASPSRDWLTVVQSGRARNKIRQFFNRADREDNLSLGRAPGRGGCRPGRGLPQLLHPARAPGGARQPHPPDGAHRRAGPPRAAHGLPGLVEAHPHRARARAGAHHDAGADDHAPPRLRHPPRAAAPRAEPAAPLVPVPPGGPGRAGARLHHGAAGRLAARGHAPDSAARRGPRALLHPPRRVRPAADALAARAGARHGCRDGRLSKEKAPCHPEGAARGREPVPGQSWDGSVLVARGLGELEGLE